MDDRLDWRERSGKSMLATRLQDDDGLYKLRVVNIGDEAYVDLS